ncbi:hypothetical protein [Nocardia puris]|uniref:hypothetical protein n=1 Tax=Nocardia puris TaxID=208602 RepID=UPI002E1B0B7C
MADDARRCIGCGRLVPHPFQVGYGTRLWVCDSTCLPRYCSHPGPRHPLDGPALCARLYGHSGDHAAYTFAQRTVTWPQHPPNPT